jgi:hypothetical protein
MKVGLGAARGQRLPMVAAVEWWCGRQRWTVRRCGHGSGCRPQAADAGADGGDRPQAAGADGDGDGGDRPQAAGGSGSGSGSGGMVGAAKQWWTMADSSVPPNKM